LATVTETE